MSGLSFSCFWAQIVRYPPPPSNRAGEITISFALGADKHEPQDFWIKKFGKDVWDSLSHYFYWETQRRWMLQGRELLWQASWQVLEPFLWSLEQIILSGLASQACLPWCSSSLRRCTMLPETTPPPQLEGTALRSAYISSLLRSKCTSRYCSVFSCSCQIVNFTPVHQSLKVFPPWGSKHVGF